MAKARARTTTRKVKDRWKAKNWYTVLAPSLFNNVPVAETLAEAPESLIGRVTEVSLQDLTNDFRKSHIKIRFTVDKVDQNTAHSQLKGTLLTSDYLRRISRVDGVFDVETRDGALLRVKPFAIAEKRIQSSQKKLIRNVMRDVIAKEAKVKTLNSFIKDCLDGKIGSEIYKNCKIYYPVKRIEVNKTEIIRLPTVIIEDEKLPEKPEEPEQPKEPLPEESEVPAEEEITEEKPAEEELPKEETEVPAEEELPPEEEKPKRKTRAKTKTAAKKKTTVKKTAKKKKEEDIK
jgi:small subunit ribosomal protein S3Ae